LFFYDKWKKQDKKISDLVDLIDENSVLVFNKSRVIPARIQFDWKEIFLSKQIKEGVWECMIKPWKKFKEWAEFELWWMKISVEKVLENWLREVCFQWDDFFNWLNEFWETPLPPYIKEKSDPNRYQTVFSEEWKSVAAPTASLHFTEEILEKLKAKWVQIEFVHLDVWLWTFLPVKTENILEHEMHSENFSVDKNTAENLNKAKKEWKKIIAVWTTSIRVLESVANKFNWEMKEFHGDTNIFIYPWYEWKFVDEMITNFHLPKSTLLMLVASFIWKDEILKIYNEAVEKKYRFYSFGDAMYLKR
jgi:S-adenosylmethionine:tRNA ribosyltransferase-isomerase